MPDGPKYRFRWEGWREQITREVDCILDIRKFEGRAIWPWLFLAATWDTMSLSDIDFCLFLFAREKGVKCERTRSWVNRHRWMCEPPELVRQSGRREDADGKKARAVQVMNANPRLSIRQLVATLKEHGIKRSREWVRKHRCDPVG